MHPLHVDSQSRRVGAKIISHSWRGDYHGQQSSKRYTWQSRSLHILYHEISLRKERAFIQRVWTNQKNSNRNKLGTKGKGV